MTFASNGVDQVTGRELAYRGYGVHGAVAPGSTVRVFHPQSGVDGEEIYVNPETGTYGAYWTVSGSWAGAGVTRVELLVRGTLEGAGTGGTDAVADKRVWAVLPASSESYGYDGAGRTVEDSLWTYTWNGMGRLVGMQRKAGTSVEPELTSEEMAFVYDAEGRRTQKTRTRTYSNAPAKVERSKVFWTDWLPAYEELSVDGGTPSRRWFVWGQDVSGSWDGAGGIGGLLAIREEGGRTLLPVHDGLGNITAVVNALNGETVARYDYAPFGELLAESGEVNACPFRYQSKYYDAETGLSYFGYRYYSAKLGRWISRDPLGEDGGFNLYGYCGNDPVNGWDYLGLAPEFVGFVYQVTDPDTKLVYTGSTSALRGRFKPMNHTHYLSFLKPGAIVTLQPVVADLSAKPILQTRGSALKQALGVVEQVAIEKVPPTSRANVIAALSPEKSAQASSLFQPRGLTGSNALVHEAIGPRGGRSLVFRRPDGAEIRDPVVARIRGSASIVGGVLGSTIQAGVHIIETRPPSSQDLAKQAAMEALDWEKAIQLLSNSNVGGVYKNVSGNWVELTPNFVRSIVSKGNWGIADPSSFFYKESGSILRGDHLELEVYENLIDGLVIQERK